MTRVVSIYLPNLATDRIRRADPSIPVEQAMAVIAKSGSKRWVSAADAAARAAGVRVGMPAAKAQALFQGLMLIDADLDADNLALERLSHWALTQYSPIVAMDLPDGIVMDTEGADHLRGGEQSMLTGIVNLFLAKGLTARVAVLTQGGPGLSTTVLVYYLYQQAFQFHFFGYGSTLSILLFAIVAILTFAQWQMRKRIVFYES